MIRKKIYPKTKRVGIERGVVTITEKLDGSNIGFFKLDGELIVATRNNIIKFSEIEEVRQILYKGMYEWLITSGDILKQQLLEKSGFFGEWLGMGKLKYKDLDKRVYMFAKANIDTELDIRKICYKNELFIYPFLNKEIPSFIGIVPIVKSYKNYPTIEELDNLYNIYKNDKERNVEGFIILQENHIKKYVRMKNGKLEPHKS